jgi:hypothetical protein
LAPLHYHTDECNDLAGGIMAKLSITLPNATSISLESESESEMRQMAALLQSGLLRDLRGLPPTEIQHEDVPNKPDKDISVPANCSVKTVDPKPTRASSIDSLPPPQGPQEVSQDEQPAQSPEVSPQEPRPELPGELPDKLPEEPSRTTQGNVLPPQEPPRRETPAPVRSNVGPPADDNPPHSSIPPNLSDPRMGLDFTTFCRAVNPIGDMRKVVVAAEGAARNFSMENVDSWELGHLFDKAGWSQPHSFTQALRNAARSKFRWLERVPGRAGRYSVTDAGRAVVLKGTNYL